VFLVSEVIKALIVVLLLGALTALCVMLWRATGHVTPYEDMPWRGWGVCIYLRVPLSDNSPYHHRLDEVAWETESDAWSPGRQVACIVRARDE
jgi:hypothetical protein